MSFVDYNIGIPNGPNNPSADQPLMQTNTNAVNQIIGIDHIPFNTALGGYHTVVHLSPFSTVTSNPPNNQPIVAPTPVLGIGELFSAEINDGLDTDTALYFQTGKGKLFQLTSNVDPVAADHGYTFLPGGLILQWGFINSTTSSPFQTLLFATNNIDFPNNCFTVWTQVYGSGTPATSQANIDIRASTISTTGFQWVFVTNSGQYTGFYWMALGN